MPPVEITAACDRRLLSQALTNLLNNAAAYTPPEGTVWSP